MATFRFLLLLGLILIGATGCSKKRGNASEPSKPPPQPLIPAGVLANPQIRFEFAIYYLPVPAADPLAALNALLASDYPGIQRVDSLPEEPSGICVAAKIHQDVAKSYAPPSPEALARFGRGVSKAQADELKSSRHALILDFGYPQTHSWDSLRAACKFTSQLARQTGGLLWDEETREVFTPDAWDEGRLKGWESGVPNVSRHAIIHANSKGEFVRAISLGMGKFGLPDVVVENFSWSANKNIGDLINLFAQAISEGAKIEKPGEYDLDLKALDSAEARDPRVNSLVNRATAKAQLTLRQGNREDGDPNNRLIELTFERYPGNDAHARQNAMIESLFGWRDAIKKAEHDKALDEASQRTRDKLPSLRTMFQQSLPPGEFILLKAPFNTPDGGHEYMWIEVTKWDGEKIKGLLKNDPFHIPTLHGGQMVDIEQKSVFDYIRHFADGTEEGNETGAILEKMSGTEEKR